MIENWRQVLWALRVPVEPYHGTPLPTSERCPLLGHGCGASNVCRYEKPTRYEVGHCELNGKVIDYRIQYGRIDGRCLAKKEVLGTDG